MLFIKDKGKHFGFKNNVFINHSLYVSISRIGNYVDEEGFMGPTECGAISLVKRNAFMKAFSESVERRSLVFGAKRMGPDNLVSSVELIQKKICYIPYNYSIYHEKNPVVDTTGTAAHRDPVSAVYNAVVELFEKNAIFLLWYGGLGAILEEDLDSIYMKRFRFEGGKVTILIQDTFFPLLVAACVFESFTSPVRYKFGVGSGFYLEDAVEKALSEAFLLGQYYEKIFFEIQEGIEKRYNSVYDNHVLNLINNVETINQIKKLQQNLPRYKSSNQSSIKNDLSISEKIDFMISNLPSWIKEIFIMNLRQVINPNIVVVKAYSPQLLSHIPIKKHIDLNVEINKKITNLSKKTIENIPDCPIV